MLEDRTRAAMNGDARPIAREIVRKDRVVAFGHPRRDPGRHRHRHRPEVLLLEALFEGVDVVLLGLTGLLLRRLLVEGQEVDDAAVGRPRYARDRRRVIGQLARLAPLIANQQISGSSPLAGSRCSP